MWHDCVPLVIQEDEWGPKTLTSQGPPLRRCWQGPLEELWQGHYGNWDGSLMFCHLCVVMDTVDEVLLVKDLLLCDSSGPADIIQSEVKMMFRGAIIPLKMVRLSVVRCVTIVEHVEVPPMEEVIVDACVWTGMRIKKERREWVAGRDAP